MVDSDADADGPAAGNGAGDEPSGASPAPPEEVRREVEERYDLDEFGPEDMARMSGDEWEAAFDPDSWITGPALLDRVEADLRARIADRDVFAVLEREAFDGEECLLAYSDEGYAVVRPDGSVEGRGTVLRDVKPTVALASMDSYEVPAVPEDAGELPNPDEVRQGTGRLGNRVMLAVAGVQVLAGLFLLVAWLVVPLSIIAPVVAFGFLGFGAFLFVVVANARLSDRFRAAEYRDRLRAAGVASEERPAFVPGGTRPAGGPEGRRTSERGGTTREQGASPDGRPADAESGGTRPEEEPVEATSDAGEESAENGGQSV